MKKFFYSITVLLVSVMFILTGCSVYNENPDESVNMSVRRIATENSSTLSEMLTEARSAVVGIAVDMQDGYAIGSGVAISDGGLIITNNHVIEGGNNITLYYADKTTGSARVLWTDSGLDLAVILSSREIPYLGTDIGDIEIGEEVYALGTPLTLEFKHTVTHGIVSAVNRTLETESFSGSSFLQSLIQHDAAINPGNSGGPLINSKGQVIGINTLKASEGEGIGFAIPIEIAKIVIEKLKDNPDFVSPYLGVFGFDSDIALAYGEVISQKGVYVISCDGPAKDAGLSKGDLVFKLGDFQVDTLLSLRKAILSYNSGDSVLISYIRNGQKYEKLITLE